LDEIDSIADRDVRSGVLGMIAKPFDENDRWQCAVQIPRELAIVSYEARVVLRARVKLEWIIPRVVSAWITRNLRHAVGGRRRALPSCACCDIMAFVIEGPSHTTRGQEIANRWAVEVHRRTVSPADRGAYGIRPVIVIIENELGACEVHVVCSAGSSDGLK